MARAHPRQPARQDFSTFREEAAQRPVILVVEHARAGFAHGAGLGGTSHASSSSSSSNSGATAAATTGFGCSLAASTHMYRNTPSSSFTARSYSGSTSPVA